MTGAGELCVAQGAAIRNGGRMLRAPLRQNPTQSDTICYEPASLSDGDDAGHQLASISEIMSGG